MEGLLLSILGFVGGCLLTGGGFYVWSRRELLRGRAREASYRSERDSLEDLFEILPAAIWVEDCSGLQKRMRRLQEEGVRDWEAHIRSHPELVRQAADWILVERVNRETCRHMGVTTPEALKGPLSRIASEGNYPLLRREILALGTGRTFLREKMTGVEIPGQGVRDFLSSIFLPRLWEAEGRMVVILQDITEWESAEEKLRRTLEEKELLVKEVHHRVKNNLQVISSILRMQASVLTDPSLRTPLENCQSRVESMALLHQLLYQGELVDQLDLGDYLDTLLAYLESGLGKGGQIRLEKELQSLSISVVQAVPCALATVEIISNAYQHAFAPEQKGSISVRLEKEAASSPYSALLRIADDGNGFSSPHGGSEAGEGDAAGSREGLGSQLIAALVDQMDGWYDCRSNGEGTAYTLRF